MKKIKDLEKPPRQRWVTNNPDALATTLKDMLNKSWHEVVDSVTKHSSGVVLIQNNEMIGVVVPESLLHEFYSKSKDLEVVDPVMNVSEDKFRNNFESCATHLALGENLIVFDEQGNALFGVACKEFSSILETDKNSVVGFQENIFNSCDEWDLDSLAY